MDLLQYFLASSPSHRRWLMSIASPAARRAIQGDLGIWYVRSLRD